jgi:DNA-binding PadR family transcriptional regulator
MSPAVFAHGHLRLYLLSLLAERSMHGYELIQALADRFGGTYVPSAGTIYPRLAKLEEEGLVTKTADGRKTVYSVRRLADEVRSSVDDAMRSLRADLAAAAREARNEAGASRKVTRVDDDRMRSRAQLHEAESLLTEFRAEMRTELRPSAADGRLDAATVELLRTGLRELRKQITAALRDAP